MTPVLAEDVLAATCGIELLAAELAAQVPVQRVDWRPPVDGAAEALAALALRSGQTARANDEAVARMRAAAPVLTSVVPAREAVPGMASNTILHAGPPSAWDDMAGPVRGAVVGALMHEGLADSPDAAAELVRSGAIELAPTHDRGAVGPMAGVVSASMPMWVVEDPRTGARACCTLNEGLGRVLRYGAFDAEVLERLAWMRDVLAPVLRRALAALGDPLDLRSLIAQALQMGDECHNRNRAATSLFLRELLPLLVELPLSSLDVAAAARFIAGNDHFFLNLAMPAAKVTAEAAAGVPGSSVVTVMARNGTEFGVKTSGTGSRWFTGPAQHVEGLFFPGYGREDACADLGDSAITETVGLGAFAMAAAPAIVSFVGGTAADAAAVTTAMYELTWGESEANRIPALGFRGSPLGIDVRAVVRTGRPPVINTGIAHREAGVGQIGAGLVRPPMGAFVAAVRALAEER